MGTDFDDFSSRATAFATDGVSAAQQANRGRLRDAMSAGGLSVYSGEWSSGPSSTSQSTKASHNMGPLFRILE
jgi:hypothetical protein